MNQILESCLHPSEVFALVKYAIGEKKSEKPLNNEKTFVFCYEMLNKTSRSFARVIQSLDAELQHPVALFYLVLRALDTIEDDMTLNTELKCKVLRAFHIYTLQDGWNFDQSGPDEKDAPLLKGYENIIVELKSIKPEYLGFVILGISILLWILPNVWAREWLCFVKESEWLQCKILICILTMLLD
jgi:farnesyl-diphosphate farnesyltransferase